VIGSPCFTAQTLTIGLSVPFEAVLAAINTSVGAFNGLSSTIGALKVFFTYVSNIELPAWIPRTYAALAGHSPWCLSARDLERRSPAVPFVPLEGVAPCGSS